MAISKGTHLFHPGQECPGFVVVHKGVIRVSITAENGREIVLYRVRPGDVCLQTFSALVHGTPYTAGGLAETDLVIEIVPPHAFQDLVVTDDAFRDRLFGAVADRFSDLERLVEDVALTGIPARLARALLRMADSQGAVNLRHEALAIEIGTAREVISRQLAAFTRSGLISGTRGVIQLVSLHGLKALAGDW
jgi:CRP/FNR family transcriptional regulator